MRPDGDVILSVLGGDTEAFAERVRRYQRTASAVAELTGRSLGTVTKQLLRAYERLRGTFKGTFDVQQRKETEANPTR